ncbi:hypothetical protein EDD22DRAFT_861490 [Suillus occidentalis]|nr:hypothetical protein EDD22DRAFT_861490 [Suillus occidentalis]
MDLSIRARELRCAAIIDFILLVLFLAFLDLWTLVACENATLSVLHQAEIDAFFFTTMLGRCIRIFLLEPNRLQLQHALDTSASMSN